MAKDIEALTGADATDFAAVLASHMGLANDPATTTGLTYGYKAGLIRTLDGNIIEVPSGTIVISDDITNTVYYNRATNAVEAIIVGNAPHGSFVFAFVETVAGEITLITDQRAFANAFEFENSRALSDTIRGQDVTSDDTPNLARAQGGNAYAQATEENKAGADILLNPGIGSRSFEIIDYSHVSMVGCVVTVRTNFSLVTYTEGVEWSAATSNAVTANNLAAAIGVDAVVVGSIIYITNDSSIFYRTIYTTAASAGMVATQGLDGSVLTVINTRFGEGALTRVTLGVSNTAIGEDSCANLTTGEQNTALGIGSLFTVTTGGQNTAIGVGADIASDALTNATAIGAFAVANASNTIQVGDSSVTAGRIGAPVAVASLPAAATVGAGARAVVTDALLPAFGVAVADGGAVTIPVFSDGGNWIVG